MDAPIPAVDQAKQHLQLRRLVQGHLHLDSNRLFYYCKIFYAILFLTIIGQNHCFPYPMTVSSNTYIEEQKSQLIEA